MLENIGVLAALGAMLFWGLGDFYIQRTTRKLGDVEALFFIGLIGCVVLLPFIINDLLATFSNPGSISLLIMLGIFALIVSLINFQALKEGKLAVIEPIMELELPVTMIVAMMILQESPTMIQIILSSLLFLGILLISVSKNKGKIKMQHLLEKGAILAVITSLGMGFMNSMVGVFSRQTSPLLTIWFSWTVFALICLIFLMSTKGMKGIIADAKANGKIILAEGFFDTIAWVLFAVSVVTVPVGIATAISESYPAIAITLGIFVNKEIINKRQFLGISLAILCCIALALIV